MTWIIIVGIVIFCIVGYMVFKMKTYNDLIKSRNKVQNSWAQIDAQLQRRFDLIPNLVETVRAFTIYEKDILDNVISIRNLFMNANNENEKYAINTQLNLQLKKLYEIIDGYPHLKSNKNFLELQLALAEIEEDIAYARQFYNDAVTIYNNKLMMFPSNIIANKYNLKEEKLFDAMKEAESPPIVSFKDRRPTCPVCGATVSNTDRVCQYCGATLI